MVIAKIKSFCIWVVDVKLEYFQPDNPLIREIFIMNPPHEFYLSPEECLIFLKPIYRLADLGDEWHRTLDDHVQFDLKMTPTIIGPSLYCQLDGCLFSGINRGYVDYICQAGANSI